MKSKNQKRSEFRKNAEVEKARRKTIRNMKSGMDMSGPAKKGKSTVPQSKRKK